ncbi:MAG: baseplate J/gp47 family protein [Beijerinckiaceae bacterium]
MTIRDLDLDGLPPPEVVEPLDFEAIRASLIADYKVRYPGFDVDALESDPVIALLEVAAYRELVLRARINDSARANLLAFAKGGDLDQLGAFYDVARLTGESDDRMRDRVVLAIIGRSPGGTRERYKYIAMTADVRIADVVVWNTGTDPYVRISILNSLNNGVPYPDMLEAVEAALTADNVQMVNDTFIIAGAVKTTVNIAADVWLLPTAPQSAFTGLAQALRDAWAAEGGLGRDLNVAWITARLMRPGIARVAVTAPAGSTAAQFFEAIALGTITLTDRGREF